MNGTDSGSSQACDDAHPPKRNKKRRLSDATLPLKPPKSSIIQSQSKDEEDFVPNEHERLLDDFVRLHPMCSMSACSSTTMSLLLECQSQTTIPFAASTSSSKTHDDQFLRSANVAVGERPCAMDEACLCKFIARVRYGKNDTRGFVCREYMTPEQQAHFLNGGKLQHTRSKCLVCYRYLVTYMYTLARNVHNFEFPLKDYSQPVLHNGEEKTLCALETAEESDLLPLRVSKISSIEGYHPSVMLMPDREFANRRAARETALSSLLFEPCVRFCSSHYQYVRQDDGEWQIVQCAVGLQDKLQGLGFFAAPPSELAEPMAASTPRPVFNPRHGKALG